MAKTPEKKSAYPSDEADKFVLRFPPRSDMRGRLAEAAKANGRSMNAELLHRLEATFETIELDTTPAQDDLLARWAVMNSIYRDTKKFLSDAKAADPQDLDEISDLEGTIAAVHDELLKLETKPNFPPYIRRATVGEPLVQPSITEAQK